MHKLRWCSVLLLLSSYPTQGEGREGVSGGVSRWKREPREDRSLVNTFPFNLAEGVQDNAISRQTEDEVSVNFNEVAEAGQRCIDKIVMEEETEYDEVMECNHSYDRRCHTSFSTTYTAQQEEECEDNYKKNCFIQYSPTAYNATVEICRESLVKDCSVDGPVVCSTEYTSECQTVQHEHQVEDDVADCRAEVETKCNDVTSGYTTSQECSKWPIQRCDVNKKSVTKYSPQTSCQKVPIELCGPSSCPTVPGPKECFQTTKTITSEKPEEECTLEPRQSCKHVTKLVPQLKPSESCIDVPKEICSRSLKNPRKVSKPVIKKWCYVPSQESGLNPFSDSDRKPDNQGKEENNNPSQGTSCPRSCIDAKSRGVCDPRCNQYADDCGIPVCQPPTTTTTTTTPAAPTCPSSCRVGYQRNKVCEPQCDIPECGYDPDCDAPVCPLSCTPGFQTNGRCQPECDIPECNFDPDCEPPPYNPPAPATTPAPTTTTTRPPTTTRTTTTTAPACPASCRPGFQNNGNCELQCHIPGCGYDPDCNKPPPQPETLYLPPEADSCPPNSRGCGSASKVRGLAVPSRRTGRKSSQRSRAPSKPKKSGGFNNWDMFFRNGLIKRRG